MKRFAIALTVLAAACAASSVMAQASVSDQLRALRGRRSGGGSPAAASGAPAPNQAQAAAQTQEDPEMVALAKTKGCLACHGIDTRVIGPTFKDIAAKYEISSDDVARLMESIQHGSKGAWGVSLTMPANKRVSELEAKKLAAWILQMK